MINIFNPFEEKYLKKKSIANIDDKKESSKKDDSQEMSIDAGLPNLEEFSNENIKSKECSFNDKWNECANDGFNGAKHKTKQKNNMFKFDMDSNN